MNRLEALLEALKETNRHIEAESSRTGADYPTTMEARMRADKITAAILEEKEPMINPPCPSSPPAEVVNPARENVLAKLRATLPKFDDIPDKSVLFGANGVRLTHGDLRRWVESEKGAGK